MTKLTLVPKSVANLSDEELGRQLVDQYGRACNGMVEYVAFGALAANAKVRVDSTRGVNSPERGPALKGQGFKAWLKEYTGGAVTEPTAYRYIDLAEIVRDEVGAGQRVDFYHVLKGAKLDSKETKLREKVEHFVAGKSQRQLLIGAGKWETTKAPSPGGGVETESEQERHERLLQAARDTAIAAFSAIDELGDRWMLVKDEELQLAIKNAKAFAKQAEAWLGTPPNERVQLKIETLLGKEVGA